jgi:hypothetical protein
MSSSQKKLEVSSAVHLRCYWIKKNYVLLGSMEISHFEVFKCQTMMKRPCEWQQLLQFILYSLKVEMTPVKSPVSLALHGLKTIEE